VGAVVGGTDDKAVVSGEGVSASIVDSGSFNQVTSVVEPIERSSVPKAVRHRYVRKCYGNTALGLTQDISPNETLFYSVDLQGKDK
jgi:hypothetical protein